MAEFDYAKQKQKKDINDTRKMLEEMPEFVDYYFKANSLAVSPSSQRSYMYDIFNFLNWFSGKFSDSERKLKDMTLEDIETVSAKDILDYLSFMRNESDTVISNSTIARRCAALNSFFSYFEQYGYIKKNPMNKIKRPRVKKDGRIIRLEDNEVERLLDSVLNGTGFDEHQKKYLKNLRKRDYAIIILLLTSGIRVSELVGLNIDDVSFENNRIQIVRKGDKKQYIPLSDKTLEILEEYIEERKLIKPAAKSDEDALFLSSQQTRMTTASVENIIKKYSKAAKIDKPITPHKLRKTYGTNLYNKTHDIYLVATALGHESVATTTKHYVATNEKDLENVRNL